MKIIKNIILWCGYGKTNENVEYGRNEVGGGGEKEKAVSWNLADAKN